VLLEIYEQTKLRALASDNALAQTSLPLFIWVSKNQISRTNNQDSALQRNSVLSNTRYKI